MSEAVTVFVGEDEAEDHVPEVARIGGERGDPVVISNRVRVAPQVTKIPHRHECTDEELVLHLRWLDNPTEHCERCLIRRVC